MHCAVRSTISPLGFASSFNLRSIVLEPALQRTVCTSHVKVRIANYIPKCRSVEMCRFRRKSLTPLIALLVCTAVAFAQGTKITAPKNNYKPADDVQIG